MDTEKKQLELDKRYIRMASIWAENSYCQRRKVGALIVKDLSLIHISGICSQSNSRIYLCPLGLKLFP